MITLHLKDTTAIGKITNEIAVSFSDELVTVKEIIIKRVMAEVKHYNNKMPEYFRGLVEPGEAEKTLNGYKLKAKRKVDPEQQGLVALDAFKKNAYFVLIDNIQAESLDQMISINEQTNISFLQLTPLVGG